MQASIVALDRIATTLKTDVAGLLQPPGAGEPKRVDPPNKFLDGRVIE